MNKLGARLLVILSLHCAGGVQAATTVSEGSITLPAEGLPEFKTDPHTKESQGNQISGVVRAILQDTSGSFWFGSQDGAARYDGTSLVYFDIRNGMGHGFSVQTLAEDQSRNIWIGTGGGLTKYDGASFTTFTQDDGLISNDVWGLFVDRTGVLWIATIDGVCRYDGTSFSPFVLPLSTKKGSNRGVSSPAIVWSMMEDSAGDMWFATEGDVYKYDGESLAQVSVMDEETDTYVSSILEDRNGHIWFSTQNKGVLRFDGKTFTNPLEQEGPGGSLIEDSHGNLWFSTLHFGVYRYDGESFTRFSERDGMASHIPFRIMEDNEGRIWTVGWLGVYRYDGESFVNVTRDGPW